MQSGLQGYTKPEELHMLTNGGDFFFCKEVAVTNIYIYIYIYIYI